MADGSMTQATSTSCAQQRHLGGSHPSNRTQRRRSRGVAEGRPGEQENVILQRKTGKWKRVRVGVVGVGVGVSAKDTSVVT